VTREVLVLALLWGCAEPEDPSSPGPSETVAESGIPPIDEPESGETGETGVVTDPACDEVLPSGPLPMASYPIRTTEDFDFDGLGKLVYANAGSLMAADPDGTATVVSPGVDVDAHGIQVLSDGNVVMAQGERGMVTWIDRASGGTAVVAGGLSSPNALDIADGDVMYVGELMGRVTQHELATGTTTMVHPSLGVVYGLALNEAQDRLYVTTNDGIFELRELADGSWSQEPRTIFPLNGYRHLFDGLEVDVCGNVYALEFYSGKLFRIDPETLEAAEIAEVGTGAPGSYWVSTRWGSDRGGWRRDVLYVTDRSVVHGIEVGVRGRSQPVDAVP
jgi:DNA-binding beta-propeller fold protein YncE